MLAVAGLLCLGFGSSNTFSADILSPFFFMPENQLIKNKR